MLILILQEDVRGVEHAKPASQGTAVIALTSVSMVGEEFLGNVALVEMF